jgi:hypothetical protein
MDRPDVTMMYAVHNAFRRELARMQAATAWADDPTTRDTLCAGWTTFRRYLTIHHIAEDEMLWPPTQAKLSARAEETGLLIEMTDEHSLLDPILREIDHELAQGSSARLDVLFGDLAAVLTGHLEHEEAAALPLVQETLSVPEWKAFADNQRRRIGLRGAGWFFSWLLDDAPPDTRDTVLAIIPPPLRLAYRLIWEPRYRHQSPWRRDQSARHSRKVP